MMKTVFGMTVLAALVLSTGFAAACPFGKTAQDGVQGAQQQTATTSDQVPLPAGGSTTETKTGG
jgi:hypothetical protein